MSQLTWVLCGDILGQNLCLWIKNTFLRYADYYEKMTKLLTKEKDWRKGGLTCVAWYILCVKVEECQRGDSVLDSNLFIFSWDQYLLWQVFSCWGWFWGECQLLIFNFETDRDDVLYVFVFVFDIQLWDKPQWCSFCLCLCLWYSTLTQTAMMFSSDTIVRKS